MSSSLKVLAFVVFWGGWGVALATARPSQPQGGASFGGSVPVLVPCGGRP